MTNCFSLASTLHSAPNKFLLATANAGSLFENPKLLQAWRDEFTAVVREQTPLFFALHLQELGGKVNDFGANDHVLNQLVNIFFNNDDNPDSPFAAYTFGIAFMDQDNSKDHLYTAMGSIYLVHKSIIHSVRLFSFEDQTFHPINESRQCYKHLSEGCPFAKRVKFPLEYFPLGRFSRKGFMRTKWLFASYEFDFTNIHLFHDESNLVAIDQSPSPYALYRRKALRYCLDALRDNFKFLFIFGDFNFRVDTHLLKKHLVDSLNYTIQNCDRNNQLSIFDSTSAKVLNVMPKKFHYHQNNLDEHSMALLKNFDTEKFHFDDLIELPVTFPPSYPFREDAPTGYNGSRCPSWCDRIVYCDNDKQFSRDIVNPCYRMLGAHTLMGDHKPIVLSVEVPLDCPTATNGSLSS